MAGGDMNPAKGGELDGTGRSLLVKTTIRSSQSDVLALGKEPADATGGDLAAAGVSERGVPALAGRRSVVRTTRT